MLKKQLLSAGIVFLSLILSSCCSAEKTTKDTTNSGTPAYKAVIPLPPGNADMRISIVDVTENEQDIITKAKVEQVTGYGPSTPPVSVGSEIEIHFMKQSAKNFLIEKNSHLYLRASHLFSPGDEKGYWSFVQVNNE